MVCLLFIWWDSLSSEVKEAGERVRTAIRHTKVRLQPQRMVVNLSPADIRKKGAAFDLPIAAALVLASGSIENRCQNKVLMIGELSLDAKVRKVKGILPTVSFARKHGFEICVIPRENEAEGHLVPGIEVIGVSPFRSMGVSGRGEKASLGFCFG